MSPRVRRTVFRFLAVILGLMPLVCAEIILRALNLPRVPPAADPFVDLHNLKPLFEPDEDDSRLMKIGTARLNLFRPASFEREKPDGTFRVFALGGSTTQGEPFSTETAFPKWFGLCLQAGWPERQVEVINCGGLSYASYRVLAILREVLTYEPDLILIYTGHNEFLEERSYEGWQADRLTVATRGWLAELRLVQLAKKLLGKDGYRPAPAVLRPTELAEEVDALLDYRGGLEAYHRDPGLAQAVAAHFRWNLNQMVACCRSQGVPLVLFKPVSNVLDCPPMKIETAPSLMKSERLEFERLWDAARAASSVDTALELGRAALEIDPRHAGANFLVGRMLVEMGEVAAGSPYLIAARDNDVCPLRAPTFLTKIVEEVAQRRRVPLVDAEQLFSTRSPDELVGDRWLVDHIHPGVEGHQLLGLETAHVCLSRGLVDFPREDWEAVARQKFETHLSTLGEEYFQRGQQRLEGLLLWTQGRAKKVRSGQD